MPKLQKLSFQNITKIYINYKHREIFGYKKQTYVTVKKNKLNYQHNNYCKWFNYCRKTIKCDLFPFFIFYSNKREIFLFLKYKICKSFLISYFVLMRTRKELINEFDNNIRLSLRNSLKDGFLNMISLKLAERELNHLFCLQKDNTLIE